MSNQFYDSNQNHSGKIVGNTMLPVHQKDSKNFPVATNIVLPPASSFNSWVRSKPQSSLQNATIISAQGQTDYQISPPGFTKRMLLDLTVQNTGATGINILPHFLLERYEIMDSNQNILETQYGNNVWLEKIHQPIDYVNRIAIAEGINPVTFNNDTVLAPNAIREYILHLPSFMDADDPKLNSLSDRMLIRVYWSNLGCDIPASINVINADILTHGMALAAEHESKETKLRRRGIWDYRYLQPVRHAQQSISNMTPNSFYDIRLTSANGYVAYLVIFIQSNPITFANVNNYTPVTAIELLDKDNVIVGLSQNNLLMSNIASQHFEGSILSYNVKPGLYTMSFAMSVSGARAGSVTGFYKMSGLEQLRIVTPSTWTTGSYTVNVMGYEYGIIEQKDGELKSTKY